MKKRILIIGLALTGLVAVFVMVCSYTTSGVATRAVRLVISAPDGQRFSGSYVVDGVTNSVSALAPASINVQAREVTFEFKRESGDAEFRVALFVRMFHSFTSLLSVAYPPTSQLLLTEV